MEILSCLFPKVLAIQYKNQNKASEYTIPKKEELPKKEFLCTTERTSSKENVFKK